MSTSMTLEKHFPMSSRKCKSVHNEVKSLIKPHLNIYILDYWKSTFIVFEDFASLHSLFYVTIFLSAMSLRRTSKDLKSSYLLPPKKIFPKNPSKKYLQKNSPRKNPPKKIQKILWFWKYPIPYIALGGRKPFRACFSWNLTRIYPYITSYK